MLVLYADQQWTRYFLTHHVCPVSRSIHHVVAHVCPVSNTSASITFSNDRVANQQQRTADQRER